MPFSKVYKMFLSSDKFFQSNTNPSMYKSLSNSQYLRVEL
jgi:hypothetical protein